MAEGAKGWVAAVDRRDYAAIATPVSSAQVANAYIENKALLVDSAPEPVLLLPAMAMTSSSRLHLSPRRGPRRRMRLANSRPNFRPHCRIVS
jgi:hypothetical protein